MNSAVAQHMALLMAVNCVRKTALEDFLQDGKLTDKEVGQLMGDVTDKLYTFLVYLLEKPEADKTLFLELMNQSYPDNWSQPVLSEVFEEAVQLMKQAGG